jgi:hypothetical protein
MVWYKADLSLLDSVKESNLRPWALKFPWRERGLFKQTLESLGLREKKTNLMSFKLIQQNASTLLFGGLTFLVLSSKNIIIYNEEILIGLSFIAFLIFSSITLGESIREAFTFRKETIQKELQKYLDVKEALLQDLLTEYKKALLLEGQVAQLREQSCKELRTLHSTREAGLQATFATQLRNKLQILSQIEQKGQETVQRNWQQGLKYGVLEAFRQSKKTVGPQLLHQALEQLKQGQPK